MEKFTINVRKKSGKRKKIIIKTLEHYFPTERAAEAFAARFTEKHGGYDYTLWKDGKQI